jgi:hypothetical protein
MTRVLVLVCVFSTTALAAAAPQRAAPRGGRAAAAAFKVTQDVKCAAELGKGVKSNRPFCDVVIPDKPLGGVAMAVPRHRGPATLHFDLHNRFTVTPESVQRAQAYARNVATVGVLNPKGEVIGRGAAVSEFRSPADLFDRIVGGALPGGVKAIAPGVATPVDITVPAGVNAITIVGLRLEVTTRLGTQTYETPGRPVAIVSNMRIDYTPIK